MLKFTVFADAHYKKMMYPARVSDVRSVLERAKASESELVIHCGDLCNDYKGSPELVKALLENPEGFKVYGVFGNHELESADNSVESVAPFITNDSDARFPKSDDALGYYYVDRGEYRLIFTDTNYSQNPDSGDWEHNTTASWGPPAGNTHTNALAPVQLAWLELLLEDAADCKMKCIVVSHAVLRKDFPNPSADSDRVCELFARVNARLPGTVIMQVSGHSHLDRADMRDGIVWLAVNTLINGNWKPSQTDHYEDESLRYDFEDYDSDGNLTSVTDIPIKNLRMSRNTHYFSSPLSAVVTIDDGSITIDGSSTEWRYGIIPSADMIDPFKGIRIESRRFALKF